jgi:hypothetical protein
MVVFIFNWYTEDENSVVNTPAHKGAYKYVLMFK